MLSSFLLIAPMASTICFAQSAPQETAASKRAKAADAQTVPDAGPQESVRRFADGCDGCSAGRVGAQHYAGRLRRRRQTRRRLHGRIQDAQDFSADSTQDYDTTLGPHLFQRFAKDQESDMDGSGTPAIGGR